MQLKTSFLGHSFTKIAPNDQYVIAAGNPLMPRVLSLGGFITKQFFLFGETNANILRGLINLLNEKNRLTISYREDPNNASLITEKSVLISNIITRDVVSANGKAKVIDLIVAPFFKSYWNLGLLDYSGCHCTISFLCETIDNELLEVDSIKNDCIISDGSIIEPTINAFDTQLTKYFSPRKSLCGVLNNPTLEAICFNNNWQGEQTVLDGAINFSSYYEKIDPETFVLQMSKSTSEKVVVTGVDLLKSKEDPKLFDNRFWTHEHDGKSYMKPK